MLLGHRGAPRQAPENTLPSFQAAMTAGLDGVELDVRRLLDGTLVVHHDAALPDGRAVASLRRDQWPATLPTLDEALAWAAGAGAFVNVELKFEALRPDDRVGRTLDAVRAHGLGTRVIVSSFLPTLLRAALEAAPDIDRALLVHRPYRLGPLDLVPHVMRWCGCVALHPQAHLVTPALMAQARAYGWRVNTWTVNDAAQVAYLGALGVDGLIGDDPAALLAARDGLPAGHGP